MAKSGAADSSDPAPQRQAQAGRGSEARTHRRKGALSAELRRDHECGRITQRSMSRILARLDLKWRRTGARVMKGMGGDARQRAAAKGRYG